MKRSIIILFLFPFIALAQKQSEEINWTTWDQVEALMANEPRKVMVDVYTTWCGPCKMMNATTFHNSEIVEYINQNFYAIKFDAEGSEDVAFRGTVFKNSDYDPQRSGRNGTHDLTKAIAPVDGRIAYPTIVYMDENFGILAPVQGLQQPEQLKPILTFFAENIYKETTWQEYTEGGE